MNYFARLIRDATQRLDQRLGTRVKPCLGDSYRSFLSLWSRVRRVVDPVMIKITFRVLPNPSPVKLHLGCGPKHFDGYINVDMWMTEATDVICDIYKLPWPTESIDVIESHHVIEHISHRKVEDTLRQWHRVLKPGGHLYLETPHFDRTIKEYLAGNEERLLNIFGQQRRTGDTHFYGYNPERLSRLLSKVGFVASGKHLLKVTRPKKSLPFAWSAANAFWNRPHPTQKRDPLPYKGKEAVRSGYERVL